MKKSENPIKKPNSIFSGAFKAFSLFLFVALFSFFGCIELYQPSTISQLEENESNAEEGYSFGGFVTSVIATKNIDTEFSLSFTGANASSGVQTASAEAGTEEGNTSTEKTLADIAISLDGRIVYADDGLYLDLGIVYEGQEIALKVGLFDSNLYILMDGTTYQYDLSSYQFSSEGLDFSSINYDEILSLVSTALELDLDTVVDQILQFLGIDAETFSLNDFLSDLMSTPATETEKGCQFAVSIGSYLTVLIDCDENYNIRSIETNKVKVQNNVFKFVAEVNAMNDVNMETGAHEEIELPFQIVGNDIIDLSGIGIYAGYAENFAQNEIISANVNVAVGNDNFALEIVYDGTYASISTVISNVEISILASNKEIYLTVGNLKVKFKNADAEAWETAIDTIMQQEFGTTTSQMVQDFLDELLVSSQGESVSIDSLILSLLSSDGNSSITSYLPSYTSLTSTYDEETELTSGQFVMKWSDTATATLTSENEVLTSAKIETSKMTIVATFSVLESGIEFDESEYVTYYDLSSLIPVTDLASDVLTKGAIAGTISYEDLTLDYEIDLGDAISAKVSGELFGLDATVYLYSTTTISEDEDGEEISSLTWNIALDLDGVLFTTTISELQDLVALIQKTYGLTSTATTASQTTDVLTVMIDVLNAISQVSLSSQNGDILDLTYGNVPLSLSYDETTKSASATIIYINGSTSDSDSDEEQGEIVVESVEASEEETATSTQSSITLTAELYAQTPSITLPDVAKATSLSSVADLLIGSRYAFDFTAEYNNDSGYAGLTASGSIVYNLGGDLEITLYTTLETGGSDLVIRLHNSVLYIYYGDLSYTVSLASSQTNTNSTSIVTILKDLVDGNTKYGVQFEFGVFEELLQVVTSYSSLQEYLENLVLSASTNSSAQIVLDIAMYNGTILKNSDLASLTFDFENGKIYADLLGILNVTLIKNSALTMDTFDETIETEDFVESVMDVLQADENVYAISGDIDIRYSTTTFSGKLTALVTVGTDEDGKTTYTPAIKVETTALGLDSYIYLIDNTVYIDINGLQIKADLTQTTISEIETFLSTYFGISLTSTADADDADDSDSEAQTVSGQEIEVSGETDSGETAVASALETFVTILPQIDKIYLSWSELVANGAHSILLNLYTPDSLYYAEESYFSNIIAQITFAHSSSTLLPTEIVLGADIHDANTTEHEAEYYQDCLLSCETALTSSLNFAVYLYNVKVGADVDASSFSFKSGVVSAIETNDADLTELSAFNDYSKLLTMVEAIYSYAIGGSYQVGIDADITTKTTDESGSSTTNKTTIDGDVTAMFVEAETTGDDGEEEEEKSLAEYVNAFEEFKLQAGLVIGVNDTTTHTISVLYEDDDAADATTTDDGLYLTYSHDSYTTNESYFRGYIEETSMSDIVSMILSLTGIDLGTSAMKTLGLTNTCQTDFSFVQSLLGLGGEDLSDDVAKMDKMLGSIESIMKMVKEIKLTSDTSGNSTLTLKLDMATLNESSDAQIGTIALTTKSTTSTTTDSDGNTVTVTTSSPVSLSISNLVYGANEINLTLTFGAYLESNFDYDKTAEHFDLSSIDEFADIAVETLNTQSISFAGSASVEFFGFTSIDLGVDVSAQISDDGDVSLYLEMKVGSSDTISNLSSITYYSTNSAYLYDNAKNKTYTLQGEYTSRISVIEFADGALTLKRTTTYSDSKETLNKKWIFDSSSGSTLVYEVASDGTKTETNVIEIVAYALGLTYTVYNVMGSISLDMNLSLEETLKAFIVNYDSDNNLTGYTMTLNGTSILASNSIGFNDFSVTLGVSEAYSTQYSTRSYTFIDSISASKIQIIGLSAGTEWATISFDLSTKTSESDTYTTTAGKTIHTNDYYRTAYVKNYHKFIFDTDGGSQESIIYAEAYSTVSLPTPTKNSETVEIEGEKYLVEYEFEGWYYYDSEGVLTLLAAADGSMTAEMPATDTTLYANYTENPIKYRTITYVTGFEGYSINSLSSWEGNTVTLASPTYQVSTDNGDGTYTTMTYTFLGWYTESGDLYENGALTVTMPSEDIVLYAKWDNGVESTTYPVYVYDENKALATTIYVAEDETISLDSYFSTAGYSASDAILFSSSEFSDDTMLSGTLTMNSTLRDGNLYVNIYIGHSVTYSYTVVDETTGEDTKFSYVNYYANGETIDLSFDISYVDVSSNGTLSYRQYYTFNNWLDETKSVFSQTTMGNNNIALTASLTTGDKVNYCTVTFDVEWTNPPNDVGGTYSGTVTTYPSAVSSILVDGKSQTTTASSSSSYVTTLSVLQGSTLDLSSLGTISCVFKCKPIFTTYNYTFTVKAWNVGGSVVNVNDGSYSSYYTSDTYTIEESTQATTLTLSAVWYQTSRTTA